MKSKKIKRRLVAFKSRGRRHRRCNFLANLLINGLRKGEPGLVASVSAKQVSMHYSAHVPSVRVDPMDDDLVEVDSACVNVPTIASTRGPILPITTGSRDETSLADYPREQPRLGWCRLDTVQYRLDYVDSIMSTRRRSWH